MQTSILLTATFVVSVSALAQPAPAPTPAPILARDDADCLHELQQITAGMPPAPTGALASWFNDNDQMSSVLEVINDGAQITNVADVCKVAMSTPTPPASLSSSWSAYMNSLERWQSTAAGDLSSAAAECTGDGAAGIAGAGLELIVATDVPQCTAALDKYNDAVDSAGSATQRFVSAAAGVATLAAVFALF
ncbi:uncharacterized protein C8A04DRAFT_13849 [Dichotomopilus funicola]|uniref:Infection structure specific protein n=1 Tax=Dichotomopilus funicola TaxID=1934379 RepID=A0AAN6UYT5_9PEZI|nr:hypothetical protein C8A04DRAFT_13849 [Dichotomopilus funicola]